MNKAEPPVTDNGYWESFLNRIEEWRNHRESVLEYAERLSVDIYVLLDTDPSVDSIERAALSLHLSTKMKTWLAFGSGPPPEDTPRTKKKYRVSPNGKGTSVYVHADTQLIKIVDELSPPSNELGVVSVTKTLH